MEMDMEDLKSKVDACADPRLNLASLRQALPVVKSRKDHLSANSGRRSRSPLAETSEICLYRYRDPVRSPAAALPEAFNHALPPRSQDPMMADHSTMMRLPESSVEATSFKDAGSEDNSAEDVSMEDSCLEEIRMKEALKEVASLSSAGVRHNSSEDWDSEDGSSVADSSWLETRTYDSSMVSVRTKELHMGWISGEEARLRVAHRKWARMEKARRKKAATDDPSSVDSDSEYGDSEDIDPEDEEYVEGSTTEDSSSDELGWENSSVELTRVRDARRELAGLEEERLEAARLEKERLRAARSDEAGDQSKPNKRRRVGDYRMSPAPPDSSSLKSRQPKAEDDPMADA
ncbi:MAG: hypothetical protein M1817_002057 [Caeruleum heppii]|nr:MAG: hypothetical protein M1817_002057 [Caeruleum heppii]